MNQTINFVALAFDDDPEFDGSPVLIPASDQGKAESLAVMHFGVDASNIKIIPANDHETLKAYGLHGKKFPLYWLS